MSSPEGCMAQPQLKMHLIHSLAARGIPGSNCAVCELKYSFTTKYSYNITVVYDVTKLQKQN